MRRTYLSAVLRDLIIIKRWGPRALRPAHAPVQVCALHALRSSGVACSKPCQPQRGLRNEVGWIVGRMRRTRRRTATTPLELVGLTGRLPRVSPTCVGETLGWRPRRLRRLEINEVDHLGEGIELRVLGHAFSQGRPLTLRVKGGCPGLLSFAPTGLGGGCQPRKARRRVRGRPLGWDKKGRSAERTLQLVGGRPYGR